MGHAVLTAKDAATTSCSLVLWGDQIGVRRETIRTCMRVHAIRPNASATCPTTLREHPYIHFQRRTDGSLDRILQAREGDSMPQLGENDCGLFLFQTQRLFEGLEEVRGSLALWGRQTKEFNLLPVVPLLDQEPGNVCCVRINDLSQSIGVNTAADAETALGLLQGRMGTE